ncbi:MAG: universal stress protein [Sandaracinaceae bacterium]|nr:universal stress protein [Sandaracinaceae bacterium]
MVNTSPHPSSHPSPQPYRIVVGIDFGPSGDEAFRMGIELAREMPNAELHLVHVVVERSKSPSAERLAVDERAAEEAVKILKEYIEGKRASYTGLPFERPLVQHVRFGDPAEAIHQVAVDVDADLIIVGTRGHKGLKRLMLGSVSERLVKLAHAPVLVARPKDYTGLERSITRPEAPRPGQSEAELHAPPTYEQRDVIVFGNRTPHISGLF